MRIHEKKPTCPFVTHSNTNIIELMRHLWTLSIQTSIDSKLRNSLSSNNDNGEAQRNDTLFIFFGFAYLLQTTQLSLFTFRLRHMYDLLIGNCHIIKVWLFFFHTKIFSIIEENHEDNYASRKSSDYERIIKYL